MARQRDFDYVESRLLVPAPGISEAVERLREMGYIEEADLLQERHKIFIDDCRAVRKIVTVQFQAERRA